MISTGVEIGLIVNNKYFFTSFDYLQSQIAIVKTPATELRTVNLKNLSEPMSSIMAGGPSLVYKWTLALFYFPGIIRRVFYSCTLYNVICFCLCLQKTFRFMYILCTFSTTCADHCALIQILASFIHFKAKNEQSYLSWPPVFLDTCQLKLLNMNSLNRNFER